MWSVLGELLICVCVCGQCLVSCCVWTDVCGEYLVSC